MRFLPAILLVPESPGDGGYYSCGGPDSSCFSHDEYISMLRVVLELKDQVQQGSGNSIEFNQSNWTYWVT